MESVIRLINGKGTYHSFITQRIPNWSDTEGCERVREELPFDVYQEA